MESKINLNEIVPSRIGRAVAVEVNDDGTVSFFVRHKDGRVERSDEPFEPFLLVAGDHLAQSLTGHSRVVRLAGDGVHNRRVHFPDLPSLAAAEKQIRKITGVVPSAAQPPYRLFSDREQQALALSPARLFRGMEFQELRRLQIDIETRTTEGFDFPNAQREGDAIIMVALGDSTGWQLCLSGPELSEKEILEQVVAQIRERDPDVIEGHNLFNFDLPYLEARAKRHDVVLALGRNGSVLQSRSSRFTFGENTSTYTRYDAYGRHIVDTLHLVQLYDVGARDLESYGLKSAARHFGVAAPDRTYIPPEQITRVYEEDPKRLQAYNLDDIRETEALSRILSPSYFYQTQLIPLSYQNCTVRGNATRIEALLVGTYLEAKQSVPTPRPARSYPGGLTESFAAGVFTNVWHMDVQSLYPSIIVSKGLTPAADELGIFNGFLSELRDFRLAAKEEARLARTAAQRDRLNALQKSFKILINSFYGYAGFAQGSFNDFMMAERVTAAGREILTRMLDALRLRGAKVIEMDTDGLYFIPPADGTPEALQAEIQAQLPQGIDVELDQQYEAMFSYKSKNYALLGRDGKISLTGAALKSRGLEPFQRQYIREVITRLLSGQASSVADLNREYEEKLRTGAWPLAMLAKRETLSVSPESYQRDLAAGKTRRSAAFELALKSSRRYRQGDQVVYYVTGNRKTVSIAENSRLLSDNRGERDENIPFYLAKLEELKAKFAEFAGGASQPTLF